MAVDDRIVDGGKHTAAVYEGVRAGGVVISPDDLAKIVDAERRCAISGQRIVESSVYPAA